MPKTKLEDFIYTVLMVIVMVYAMVCYNVSIHMHGLTNIVFLEALKELPLMAIIAFILEYFLIGKLSTKIASKLINLKEEKPIFTTTIISSIIVSFMCPIMSLIGSLLFGFTGLTNIIANWIQMWVLGFPMALMFQIFYAGPIVRFIFRKIFNKK